MENTESNNNEAKEPTTIELIEKVKGTEEFQTLVKNEAKSYIGSELKTVYNTFDSVVKDTLGMDKPEDVKSTEWIKQNLSKLTEAQKELEALKSKSDGNEAQEKLWNDKVSKLKKALEEKEKEVLQVAQKGFEQNVSNQIDTFLVGKNFNSTFSDAIIKTLVKANKDLIVTNTKNLDNGKVAVWNPEKGEYYTDTLGEPLSPTQVAELLFTPMFQTQKTGGNTPADTNNTGKIEGEVLSIDMSKVKSRSDFYTMFAKLIAPKGLASHSDDYLKIQRATMAHYKISELPA